MGYYAIAPAGDTSGSGSGSGSTKIDYMNDVVFGLLFLFIALWALVRLKLYFDFSRSEEAVTSMFYAAIAITAMIRSIWFLIPSSVLEGGGYTPIAITAYESYNWKGVLVSEVMLSVGSIGMYSSILLIGSHSTVLQYRIVSYRIMISASYWSHILSLLGFHPSKQLSRNTTGDIRSSQQLGQPLETMQIWSICMIVMFVCQSIIIILFVSRKINSQQMILGDSIYLSFTATILLIGITILSNRMQALLTVIGRIEKRDTRVTRETVNRIYLITLAFNVFFLVRVATECTLAAVLVMNMYSSHSVSIVISDKYWLLYIIVKHSSEVAILLIEIVIATTINRYKSQRTGTAGTTAATSSITASIRHNEYTPINSHSTAPYSQSDLM